MILFNVNELKNVSFSDLQNLITVCVQMTADDKYSLLNRDILRQPTQMQLSQN